MRAKVLCKLHALSLRCNDVGADEVISGISGINVKMVMPDILPSSRFVVLARRYPITLVGGFHGNRDGPGAFVNSRSKRRGQVEDIFVMFIRDDKHMSQIVGRVMQAHESRDSVILKDKIRLFTGSNLADNPTEWTGVSFGGMIEQKNLVYSIET